MCELLLVPSQPSTHPRCLSFCFCLQSYNSHGEEGGAWQLTGLATKIKQSNRKKIMTSSFLLWGPSFCLLTFWPSCNSLTQSKVSVWVGRDGVEGENQEADLFFLSLSFQNVYFRFFHLQYVSRIIIHGPLSFSFFHTVSAVCVAQFVGQITELREQRSKPWRRQLLGESLSHYNTEE